MEYEVKNISCTLCRQKYEIKMERDKFKIWIRDDIPLDVLFPDMPLNIQLLLVKGLCIECYYDQTNEFIGNLCDE